MSLVTNYLSPSSFDVSIAKMPNVEFFIQTINIPSIQSGPAELQSTLKTLYNIPDRLVYSDLEMTFIVDENMENYREILSWLEGMGSPQARGDQYRAKLAEVGSFYSDITIIVRNSSKNPNLKFTFTNAFPTALGQIEFDVKQTEVTYATLDATFRYDSFAVELINS